MTFQSSKMYPNTAIVLIDPYNDFLHPSGKANGMVRDSMKAKDTITHINEVIAAARSSHIPIYYGLHQQEQAGFLDGWKRASPTQLGQKEGKVFQEGSWGVQIYEGMAPDLNNGDVVVSKHWHSSSFQGTDLEYQLRQRDITHLVLCGLTANTCLESTSRYAYELGFHITIITDATAGMTKEATDAATDLIWPLFAHEVRTAKDWASTLKH